MSTSSLWKSLGISIKNLQRCSTVPTSLELGSFKSTSCGHQNLQLASFTLRLCYPNVCYTCVLVCINIGALLLRYKSLRITITLLNLFVLGIVSLCILLIIVRFPNVEIFAGLYYNSLPEFKQQIYHHKPSGVTHLPAFIVIATIQGNIGTVIIEVLHFQCTCLRYV